MSPCCHISREEPLFCFRIISCHVKQFPFLQKAWANKFVVNSGNRQLRVDRFPQTSVREAFPSDIPVLFEKTTFLKHEPQNNIFETNNCQCCMFVFVLFFCFFIL